MNSAQYTLRNKYILKTLVEEAELEHQQVVKEAPRQSMMKVVVVRVAEILAQGLLLSDQTVKEQS